MSNEEELQRQIGINLQLRRKLEGVRRDVVEECAKFCETHMAFHDTTVPVNHSATGAAYAKGLRGLIGT